LVKPGHLEESQDNTDTPPPFNTKDIIKISDNEDEVAASTNVHHLGSPFHEESPGSRSRITEAIDLGPGGLSTKPKATEMSAKEVFVPIREDGSKAT